MKFVKQYSSAVLQPFVRYYWTFEISASDIPFSQLFFPYGSFELIFYLNGDGIMKYTGDVNSFIQEKSFYSGQFTKSFELNFIHPCKCVGVSLHPWVGNMLYTIPSNKFTNQMIPLHALEKNNNLYHQLCNSKSDKELFKSLEEYLKPKLHIGKNDEAVKAITQFIITNPEGKELNLFLDKKIGLSKRRIQQRFLDTAGIPMSNFVRKIRFQKVLHNIKELNSEQSLTEIGLDSGYYDQAHFINEFKEFAGISPSQFIKQNSDLKDFMQSLVIS